MTCYSCHAMQLPAGSAGAAVPQVKYCRINAGVVRFVALVRLHGAQAGAMHACLNR